MSLVKTDVPMTSSLSRDTIRALVKAYPEMRTEILTVTAYGRPVETLVMGRGPRKVIYAAAFHANEWITAPLLLRFAEDLAEKSRTGGAVGGIPAEEILRKSTIYMVPMVDPDGVDLVTGGIEAGSFAYSQAEILADRYPDIPFPNGWKANLLGVDLNLQYPAGWMQARQIKFSQGYVSPAPRDYVGRAPLNQRESRAMAGYTEYIDPELVLAFHTQGKVIYWQFKDYTVPGARALGEKFAALSGYELADTPYASGFAGYKDWFIERFRRPGYTIEVGAGQNPLPVSQFREIYRDNEGILAAAAVGN